MLHELRARYEVVALDVAPPRTPEQARGWRGDPTATEGLTVHIADLSQADRDLYRHHFEGANAVIHLGFAGMGVHHEPGMELDGARWRLEMSNIEMAHNVFQVALEAGCMRVVMASSNHAADYYEDLILDHSALPFCHIQPSTMPTMTTAPPHLHCEC